MSEFKFPPNSGGYNHYTASLSKKVSGFDHIQRAKAKQLLNAKANDKFEKNQNSSI